MAASAIDDCSAACGPGGCVQPNLTVFVLAALTGTAAGSLAGLFHRAADTVNFLRQACVAGAGYFGLAVSVAVSAGLALAAVALVRRFAPEAAGSGVQEIEGALKGLRVLRWLRVLLVKFPAGVLALSSAMALGREGPTIQMGGAAGRGVAEATGAASPYLRHCLVAAGAGAGLTAAFNAPLAGILFVVEEMREEFRFDFVSFHCVVIACVTAAASSRLVSGKALAIPMPVLPDLGLAILPLFLLFGISAGLAGAAFNAALIRCLDAFDALRPLTRYAAVAATGALAGLCAYGLPLASGGGHETILAALDSGRPGNLLLWLIAVRLALTIASYSTGAPGGIFTPMLALGTLWGVFFGQSAARLFPDFGVSADAFAVAGMAALFAATVRAPLTGMILILEMTGNYTLTLPLMTVCITAAVTAETLGARPVYRMLLERTLARAAKSGGPGLPH